jgi:hypothetical protein
MRHADTAIRAHAKKKKQQYSSGDTHTKKKKQMSEPQVCTAECGGGAPDLVLKAAYTSFTTSFTTSVTTSGGGAPDLVVRGSLFYTASSIQAPSSIQLLLYKQQRSSASGTRMEKHADKTQRSATPHTEGMRRRRRRWRWGASFGARVLLQPGA